MTRLKLAFIAFAPVCATVFFMEMHAGISALSAAQPEVPPAVAVRTLATYLEHAPPQVTHELLGHEHSDVSERTQDATQRGLDQISELESRIAAHYPDSESGVLVRRFVALVLSDVDSEITPDSSRNRMLNELMKDPSGAAGAVQVALNLIPADGKDERSAVIKLVNHLGTSDPMLPTVEGILMSEISRRAPSDQGAAQDLLGELVDSYTMLVSDTRKQIAFIQAGIDAQQDRRVQDLLQDRLEHLQRVYSADANY